MLPPEFTPSRGDRCRPKRPRSSSSMAWPTSCRGQRRDRSSTCWWRLRPATAAYRSVGSRDLTLAVPPLAPCFAAKRVDGPTPHAADRSLFKAFLQSYRSDFQRNRWEAPTAKEVLADMKAAKATAPPSATPPSPAEKPAAPPADTTALVAAAHAAGAGEPDRGLAFTDYLLGKQRDNGGLQEAYETTCIELERQAAGKTDAGRRLRDVLGRPVAALGRDPAHPDRVRHPDLPPVAARPRHGRRRPRLPAKQDAAPRRPGPPSPSCRRRSTGCSSTSWPSCSSTCSCSAPRSLVLGLARPVVPEHRLHLGVAIVLAVLGVLLFLYRRGGSLAIEGPARGDAGAGGGLAARRPAPRSRSPGWSWSRSSPPPTTRSCASPTSAFRSSAPSAWRSGSCCSPPCCCTASPASAAPAPRSTPGAARRSTAPSWRWPRSSCSGSGSRRCCCSGSSPAWSRSAAATSAAPASPPAGSASASRSAPSSS